MYGIGLNNVVQKYNQLLWKLLFSALTVIQLCLVTTSVLYFLLALVPLEAPLSTGVVRHLFADFSAYLFQ